MSNESDQTTTLLALPARRTPASVWSNFSHTLKADMVKMLEEAEPGTLCAQHAAWDFCGYVWRLPDGRWIDQIWRYNSPVEDIIGEGLEEVIQRANRDYGHD